MKARFRSSKAGFLPSMVNSQSSKIRFWTPRISFRFSMLLHILKEKIPIDGGFFYCQELLSLSFLHDLFVLVVVI